MMTLRGVVLALALGASAAGTCNQHKPLFKDMARAHRATQTSRLGGATPQEISAKINEAVGAMGASQRPCDSFSLDELDELVRDMHACHMNEHLNDALPAGDLRRRRFGDIGGFEASWLAEREHLALNPTHEDLLRDAKCAEVLMLFTHHTPTAAKETLVKELGVALPTMNAFDPSKVSSSPAGEVYASSYTCQTGHGITEASYNGSDHILPHWPAEVHYTGTGYGPYPFWLGTAGTGGNAPIEVWWSEAQAAEKFYHPTCFMSEAGYQAQTLVTGQRLRGRRLSEGRRLPGPPPPPPPPTTDDGVAVSTPCFNLMVGTLPSAKAYLYTEAEDFCCDATGDPENLAPPQSDFMDLMTLQGQVTIETAYYSGKGYHYTETLASTEAVTDFWYTTTLDGYPLQQGEGGTDASTPGGKGVFIYHEYNYTKWAEPVALNSTTFDVPEICKTTKTTCAFP